MNYKLVKYKHGCNPQEVFSGSFDDILDWCDSKNLMRVHKNTVYTQFVDKENPRLLGSSINIFRGPHPKYEYYRVLDIDKSIDKSKTLPETTVENSGVKSWYGGGWVIAFFYSTSGNFVIKGYLKEVESEMDKMKSKGIKYFVNITIWSSGVHRSIWKSSEKNMYLCEPSKKNKKWEFRKYSEGNVNILKFKRLPKRWVPEIEEFFN